MDLESLQKKSLKRAISASGNVIAGTGALLLSVAYVNPLPLILYGVGATVWIYNAVASGRYTKGILKEEQQTKQSQVEGERKALEREVESLYEVPVFRELLEERKLPGYLQQYYILVALRDQIVSLAHARSEVEQSLEDDIVHQVEYMLNSYLRLARSRLIYLQVLTGSYAPQQGSKRPPRPLLAFLRPFLVAAKPEAKKNQGVEVRRARRTAEDLSGNIESRIRQIEEEHQELLARAEQEPSAAEVHQAHAAVLEKQIALLHECESRDKRIVAQLDTFVSAFQYILDRMRASQFEAGEVTSFLGTVVEQVDETVRFAEAVRPRMDELLQDLNMPLVLES